MITEQGFTSPAHFRETGELLMPRTLDEGFRDFLGKLTPSAQESAAAKLHRASIKGVLEANFTLKRFFRMGSFGNRTSIYGHSDVDYFASLATSNLQQNSENSLRRVKDVLDARFPFTGVRVNCPAIRVPFGVLGRETTEVVFADYVEEIGGHKAEVRSGSTGGAGAAAPPRGLSHRSHGSRAARIEPSSVVLAGNSPKRERFWKFNHRGPLAECHNFGLRLATQHLTRRSASHAAVSAGGGGDGRGDVTGAGDLGADYGVGAVVAR